MGQIEIKDIVQKYDKNEVLHHMDLKIEDGEFFCLLGLKRMRKNHIAEHYRRLLNTDTGGTAGGRP